MAGLATILVRRFGVLLRPLVRRWGLLVVLRWRLYIAFRLLIAFDVVTVNLGVVVIIGALISRFLNFLQLM